MGQFLAFSVETFDSYRHGAHRLGDFSRLPVAIRAAKESLNDPRVTLAIVRDRSGRMIYCVDRRRDWSDSRDDPAETPETEASGTWMPIDTETVDLRAYRREGLMLIALFMLAAWIEIPA